MTKFLSLLSLLVLPCALHAAGAGKEPPLTVASLDLEKYMGLWFEQMRIPNNFQDKTRSNGYGACRDTEALYRLRSDGMIDVTNSCTRDRAAGERKREVAHAVARVRDKKNPAKLLVNFIRFKIFRYLGIGDGDYWILALGPVNSDQLYDWALVGSSSRKFGWILSRQKNIDREKLEEILKVAEQKGYSRQDFK
jgi:apolipoprotein D and lipocalin family protein